MAVREVNRSNWSVTRDDEGHREYRVTHKVTVDDPSDGPYTVLSSSSLPQPGTAWSLGNDSDPFAFCRQDAIVSTIIQDEPNLHWTVQQVFSTKPVVRCEDLDFGDPLLEPDRVSGGFIKFTREATEDSTGSPIRNSSFELLRGPQVERDDNRPTIRVQQNVADLEFELLAEYVDTLNDTTVFGLFAAGVCKLSNVSWVKNYYGFSGYTGTSTASGTFPCEIYYTRTLDFEVNFDGFARTILDEGTKVIRGRWDMDESSPTFNHYVIDPTVDYDNPADYARYRDKQGNFTRVLLDGSGRPAFSLVSQDGSGTETTGNAGENTINFYPQKDFSLLGLPSTI